MEWQYIVIPLFSACLWRIASNAVARINRFCQFITRCVHLDTVGVHVATVERLSNARFPPPIVSFLVSPSSSRRVAHTQRFPFFFLSRSSLFLPLSLFACASHGSIIHYVSNFRPPEFFIRSFRVVPRQRCAKIYRLVSILLQESTQYFLSSPFSSITRNIWIFHDRVCIYDIKWRSTKTNERRGERLIPDIFSIFIDTIISETEGAEGIGRRSSSIVTFAWG